MPLNAPIGAGGCPMTPEKRCNENGADRSAGRAEGRWRKGAALDLHEVRRQQLVEDARRALVRHALACGSATADDVRDLVELPPGCSPKAFGAAPGPLAKAGIIERVAYTETCRPTAHARPVSVWRIRDRTKAERWLIENPERPAPELVPPAAVAPTNETGPTALTVEPEVIQTPSVTKGFENA